MHIYSSNLSNFLTKIAFAFCCTTIISLTSNHNKSGVDVLK